MKYFPFTKDRFEHQFGVRAIPPLASIVEATDQYHQEIQLRRQALARDRNYYFRSTAESFRSQREARDLIIRDVPFIDAGVNTKTDEPIDLDAELPLLEIACHVQEDLAIMSGDADAGFPLTAGAIIFPSGWCIGDKMGQSVLQIHRPVPDFERALNRTTQQLLSRLKPERPVWRTNWGVRPSGQLDQSPIHDSCLHECRDLITKDNAGTKCFFRVERQTLSRLPGNDILFTIHTHQTPLGELQQHQAKTLLGVIQTCPEATLRYKGIWPMRDPIVEYLQESLQSAGEASTSFPPGGETG